MFESADIAEIHTQIEQGQYSNKSLNEEYRVQRAEELGCDIVYPAPNELQIDIDTEHAFEIFQVMIIVVRHHFLVYGYQVTPSKSGLPKRHITVTLVTPVTDIERVALQLALGSDRIRETLSLARIKLGQERPTCFFEKRPEA